MSEIENIAESLPSSPPLLSFEDEMFRLGAAMYGLEDTFAFGNKIELASNIEIDYANEKTGDIETLSLPARMHTYNEESKVTEPTLAFQKLMDSCEDSPFGHGNVTCHDHRVRKAMHIPASRIINIRGFDPNSILSDIHRTILPGESGIRAELLKMNVYREDGFFVAHRDTPLSSDSVGSLVVALPCAHSGGHLIVSHRDDTMIFNFAKDLESSTYSYKRDIKSGNYSVSSMSETYYSTSQPQPKAADFIECGLPKSLISYAAFYGDALHKVEKVTAGTRITLSYQLLRTEQSATPAIPVSDAETTAVPVDEADEVIVVTDDTTAKSSKVSKAEPATVAMTYTHLKVADLKNLCKSRGLKVSGNKPELIYRLQAFDTNPTLALASSNKKKGSYVFRSNIPETWMPTASAVARAHRFCDTLMEALRNKNFLPNGEKIGFPCFHLYERDEDIPDTLSKQTKASDIKLRGADALVALVAARLGLEVDILRIVYVEDGGDGAWKVMDSLPTVSTADTLASYEMIEDCYMGLGISTEDFNDESDEMLGSLEWVIGLPGRDGGYFPAPASIPRAKILDDVSVSGTGYFGNEASDGCVYAQCAITIEIPEYSERIEMLPTDANAVISLSALDKTRAGCSKRVEETAAEERLSEFASSTSHKKRKRIPQGHGNRFGYDSCDEEPERCTCF